MAVHMQFFRLLAHEDLIVHTAFAACPESFILCELGIGNGLISQFAVDLHHGEACSEAEDLGFRIFLSGEVEDLALDHFGQATFSEGRETISPELATYSAMAPGFDITKAGPDAILVEGDHGFSFAHFQLNIFGRSFSDARASCFGGGGHFITDDLSEAQMGFIGYKNLEFLLCFHYMALQ